MLKSRNRRKAHHISEPRETAVVDYEDHANEDVDDIIGHKANKDKDESNHISALVESAVEVREVKGEEGNDVRERSSLKQDYEDFFLCTV